MSTISLIFPHQLFQEAVLLETNTTIYLVEEYLFFKQYKFHQQKIAFHRATMKAYATYLVNDKKLKVNYIESIQELSDIRKLLPSLKKKGVDLDNGSNSAVIAFALIKTAQAGDVSAIRLIFDQTEVPLPKQVDLSSSIPLTAEQKRKIAETYLGSLENC